MCKQNSPRSGTICLLSTVKFSLLNVDGSVHNIIWKMPFLKLIIQVISHQVDVTLSAFFKKKNAFPTNKHDVFDHKITHFDNL